MLRVQGRRRWGFGGSGFPGFDSQVPRLAIFAIIYRQEGLFMATMNISLPEAMKHWAEQQAQSGRYSNTSDYVRDLIRKDQDRLRKVEELQALVTAGIASGPGTRSMDELRAAAKKLAMDGDSDGVHSQQEG